MVGVLVIAVIALMIGMVRYFYLMATEHVNVRTRWKDLDKLDLWILVVTMISGFAVPGILLASFLTKI